MVTIIGIIATVSFSPYIIKAMTSETKVIGLTGTYELNELPDTVLSKISNGLVVINNKGQIVPSLAESWESLEKGQEFRFHIKKDLPWNDGKPFTAKDIRYDFKDVETRVIGDYLIIFKLKRPLPIFPIFLTRPVIKNPLIGVAGLYKVEKAKVKFGQVNEIELTPNKPELPILIYRFFDSDTKLYNAYKLGEIDEMVINKKSIADDFSKWKNTEITQTIDYSQVMTLFFNLNNPFLKEDKDIRKAIAQAIPPDKFTELGDLANSPIPPVSWAYDPNVKRIQYDPERAEKLLKKSDSESTDSATLVISTFYDNLAVAEGIKDDLDKVGLKTRVEVLQAYPDQNNYDILLAPLELPADPDQYFYWHSTQVSNNITNYKNVKIDKLLEDGRDTLDPVKRKTIYGVFQKTIADDVPAYFLYYPYLYSINRK